MSRKLIGALSAALGATGGYALGSRVQRKKLQGKVDESVQASELATKLRERAESTNRRLRVENYYVRKALNELARRMRTQKIGE